MFLLSLSPLVPAEMSKHSPYPQPRAGAAIFPTHLAVPVAVAGPCWVQVLLLHPGVFRTPQPFAQRVVGWRKDLSSFLGSISSSPEPGVSLPALSREARCCQAMPSSSSSAPCQGGPQSWH